MDSKISQSVFSVLLRSLSILLVAVPVSVISLVTISGIILLYDMNLVLDFLLMFISLLGVGVVLGWVGLLLKSVLSTLFVIISLHWSKHASPLEPQSMKYRDVIHNYLAKDYSGFVIESPYQTLIGVLYSGVKYSLLFHIFGWTIMIISFILGIENLGKYTNVLIGIVTWLNPITFVAEEIMVTDQTTALVSVTLLPIAYFSAVGLENLARYTELQMWRCWRNHIKIQASELDWSLN